MKIRPLILITAAAALVLAACGTPDVTVQAGSGDGASNGINVSGQGRVAGVPDTLTLTLGVSVLRPNVSDAVAAAAEKADALIAKLKELAVEERDIQTANYSIYPEYDWRNERQELRGYRVNNTVIVKIRDLERAGEIIDAAAATAGDEVTVSGVSFSIEDNEELIAAAREAAWNDAHAKATQLANLAGVTLGKPTVISESFSAPPVVYRDLAFAEAADVAATPIEPGEQTVSVNISVTFAIGS